MELNKHETDPRDEDEIIAEVYPYIATILTSWREKSGSAAGCMSYIQTHSDNAGAKIATGLATTISSILCRDRLMFLLAGFESFDECIKHVLENPAAEGKLWLFIWGTNVHGIMLLDVASYESALAAEKKELN